MSGYYKIREKEKGHRRVEDELRKVHDELQIEIERSKKAGEELQEKNRQQEAILNNIPDIAWLKDKESRFIAVNEPFAKACGVSREELVGKKDQDIWPHDLADRYEADDKEVMATGKQKKVEEPLENSKGNKTWIETIKTPIYNNEGEVIGTTGIARDVTKRRSMEENLLRTHDMLEIRVQERTAELEKAKEFAETVINSMNDSITVIDVNNFGIIDANSVFLNNYGLKKEEVLGKTCYQVTHKCDRPCILPDNICPLIETLKTGKPSTTEHVHYLKGGEKQYIEVCVSPIIDENGKFVNVIHLERDITEQKIAEEKIKKSLNEKEVLLREIHHRVKNNMQIISSLLHHQMEYIEGKNITDIFSDSQNRILSMALVHEKLYQSSDMRNVDFKEYINDLGANLFQSYNVNYIKLNVNVEDISVDIDLAIPAGLIINELITNSLKYAFPDGKKGEINISFRSIGENMLELVVSDNGIGLPKDLDFRNTKTLGLHLVTLLAEDQLHGKIDINRDKGTEFRIKFKYRINTSMRVHPQD